MANMSKQEYIEFQKETIMKSRNIYQKALDFCPALYSKEKYMDFLSFMAKWNHLSAVNTVLLYMQYPSATYLASFKKWQSIAIEEGHDNNYMIIKDEQRKKGITLLIPFSFTNVSADNSRQDEQRYLTFKSIIVYDVSQINNIHVPQRISPIVPIDSLDFTVFLTICRERFEHEISFLPGQPESPIFRFQAAYLKGNTIYFQDSGDDSKNVIGVMKEIVRYFVYQMCKEESEKEFIFFSCLYTIFKHFNINLEVVPFSKLPFLQSFAKEKQFRMIFYVNTLTQKMIYHFYHVYLSFLSEYFDKDSNRVMSRYDKPEEKVLLTQELKKYSVFFDFNEINIISQNLMSLDRDLFNRKLYFLKNNTKDVMLLQSIKTLSEKFMQCTDKQIDLLFRDLKEGRVSATEGHGLPSS